MTVVLPTYEEAENIEPLLRRIDAALEGVEREIIVVDDRSPDGTARIADRVGADLGGVRVIERQPPPGLTRSIRDGVEAARGRYVAWMDCDLSHPPELLPELLAAAHGSEECIAVASRYVRGGADARDAFTRTYSWIINRLGTLLVHGSVLDYTTGYVLGPRDRILVIGLEGDYGEYCIRLLGIAAQDGVEVVEIPYAMVPRVEGESKTVSHPLRFIRRGVRYLAATGRLALRRLRRSEAPAREA